MRGAGATPGFGEFALLHCVDVLTTHDPTALKDLPGLAAWLERMCALPGVKEYLGARPALFKAEVGRKHSIAFLGRPDAK